MIEDFLLQSATITAEAAVGSTPPLTALGGVNRSGAWAVVADGVPCLVRPRSSYLAAHGSARDDARRNVEAVTIYFAADPLAESGGLNTRCRITVDGVVHAVQGVINVNSLDRLFQVDCERIRE